jgi:hypothetical protein
MEDDKPLSSLDADLVIWGAVEGADKVAEGGARTRDLLYRATIRCCPLQFVLVRPAIELIYAVFGDFAERYCPLRAGIY